MAEVITDVLERVLQLAGMRVGSKRPNVLDMIAISQIRRSGVHKGEGERALAPSSLRGQARDGNMDPPLAGVGAWEARVEPGMPKGERLLPAPPASALISLLTMNETGEGVLT